MAIQHPRRKKQMSDALPTAVFLTMSGGLQDAYSYVVRGKVFANAQTGNIVLMSGHFFAGDAMGGLRYLVPIGAFALGVLAAESVRGRFREARRLHWRQAVLLAEILLLFLVGFLPPRWDFIANAMTSFSCAMQVQAFRKLDGNAYASTMCIGNLRSGMENLALYFRHRDREKRHRAGIYFGAIGLFALGAGLGGVLSAQLGQKAIWVSCGLLLMSFGLMFRKHIE